MIHIFFHFVVILVLSVGLTSCTDNQLSSNRNQSTSPISIMPPSIEMADARGLNVDMMNARISQLINETRIIQERVQNLMARLTKIRSDIASQTPMVSSFEQTVKIAGKKKTITLPVPVRPKINIEAKPKQMLKNNNGVTKIRTGIHIDRTRLVLDIDGKTSHTVNFDKAAGILTLNLDTTNWNTALSRSYKLSQFQGYQAKNKGQGVIVAMSIQNTQSIKTSTIKKTGNKPARLIIDLMK